jgi:hypothetical protein
MNLISKALSDLKHIIPEEILQAAFMDGVYYKTNAMHTVEFAIRRHVIDDRVYKDLNMVGGTQTIIHLQGLPYEVIDRVNMVVRIPFEKTNGRMITTVLNISIADYFAVGLGVPIQNNRGALLGATDKVLDALLPIPNVSSEQVKLIDRNTVLINGIPNVPNNCYLTCILENDENLNNIQPGSYHDLLRLIELAVKAYIYTKLRIKVARGALVGGFDLGVFKEEIDSYADSNTLYSEQLIKWTQIAILNDPVSRNRHLRLVGALT